MKKSSIKFFVYTLAVIVLSFSASLGLYFGGVYDFLENKVYDTRMQATVGNFRNNDDFLYIGIDQRSIDSAAEEKKWGWPWPRKAYAEIVDFVSAGNPKAVIFDVFFTEPSVYGPEDDRIFAEACSSSGKVIQVVHALDDGTFKYPVKEIKDSAALIGNITSAKDSDDIIRRARISYKIDGKDVPALGLTGELLELEDDVNALEEIKNSIPVRDDGTVYLRYKDFSKYAGYAAWDILDSAEKYKKACDGCKAGEDCENDEPCELGEFEPSDFEDATVFFMFYAPGLYDICSTPLSKVYPGSGVHMTLLDNYLTGDFIVPAKPTETVVYGFIFALCAGLLIFVVILKTRRFQPLFFVLVLFALSAVNFAVTYFYFRKNIFLPAVFPLATILICYFAEIILGYRMEGKQKHFIKSAFGQYLSPSVIDKMLSEPDNLKLGGEKRHISIFFSDVQSFTTLSEGLDPVKLTELLNQYLSEMTEIILSSGGTIDKYEGDAIIAFWNAPVDIQNHAKRAIEAAMECQKKLSELEETFVQKVGRPMWTRIGINTGDAVVGNMGSSLRFDYTMFGDAVNLASRLEGLNKQFGTFVMCSEATKNEAEKAGSKLCWRELARAAVVGKSEAVTVFEPVEPEKYNSEKEKYLTFDKGLHLFYEGKFDQAVMEFSKIKEIDKPALKYIAKCEEMKKLAPENFKGVWVAGSK